MYYLLLASENPTISFRVYFYFSGIRLQCRGKYISVTAFVEMWNSELHQIPSGTPDNTQLEAEFGPDSIAPQSMELISYTKSSQLHQHHFRSLTT